MTNDKNILSIDLSKVDKELSDLDKQIAALQDRRDWLVELKTYLPSLAVEKTKTSADSFLTRLHNRAIELTESAANSTALLQKDTPQKTISEFILSLLTHLEADARYIGEQYADYLDKEYLEVRGNVFNAISRLKEAGKIEEVPEEGKQRGHKLRIKKVNYTFTSKNI